MNIRFFIRGTPWASTAIFSCIRSCRAGRSTWFPPSETSFLMLSARVVSPPPPFCVRPPFVRVGTTEGHAARGACISELTWGGGAEDIPHVLVGNKSDLVHEREVAPEEGQRLADEWGVAFIESSAKFNTNVEEVYLPCRCAAVYDDATARVLGTRTRHACPRASLSCAATSLMHIHMHMHVGYTYSYSLCVRQVFRKLIATCEARTEASDQEKKCVVM